MELNLKILKNVVSDDPGGKVNYLIRRNLLSYLIAAVSVLSAAQVGLGFLDGDGAAIKGRVVVPKKWTDKFQVTEMPLGLHEQIPSEDPPIPKNWSELTQPEQDKWWNDFQASDAGKTYIAEQEKRFDAARKFDIKIEPNGSFTVFDIPPAMYALRGRVDRNVSGLDFAFELFGQLEVVAGADEVVLGDLDITVSPLLKSGQIAPNFELTALDKTPISLDSFKGKFLIVNFWAASSEPAAAFQKNVQNTVSELQPKFSVELLGISLDDNRELIDKFNMENGTVGKTAIAGGWSHAVVSDYGIHGIPSLWMIGPEGKLVATDMEFGHALRTSGLDLAEIISHLIDGKELPVKPPATTTDMVPADKND